MVQGVQIIPTVGELSCREKAVQVQAALLEQCKGKVYKWLLNAAFLALNHVLAILTSYCCTWCCSHLWLWMMLCDILSPRSRVVTVHWFTEVTGEKRCSGKIQGSVCFGWCGTTTTWIPSLSSTTSLPWHRKRSGKLAQHQELNPATTLGWFLGTQHCQHQGGTLLLSTSKPGHLLSRFGDIPRMRMYTD